MKTFGEDKKTARGFPYVEFKDYYDHSCSLQISSLAVCENEDGTVANPLGWLWLGIDDVEPKIMKTDAIKLGLPVPEGEISGWMPYPLPKEVSLNSRMHLNEEQVRGLVARLTCWLETGEFKESK